MNRKRLLFILAFLQAGVAMAGDLLTNTNQSVHFLRNPARDASTQIDAVYTNPAGLVKLSEGLHFSFNNQSAFQTRTIRSTSPLFRFGAGGDTIKTFEGTASAPIIPSLLAAYKQGKWVLSGSLSVTGGGGKAIFDKGLPSFENLIATAASIPAQARGIAPNYIVDQHMKGANFIFGGQLGGTYQVDENFSAYLGFRMNFVHNHYQGYLRNFTVSALADQTAATYQALVQSAPNANLATLATFAAKAAGAEGIRLKSTQTGWGVAPIIGVNYHWEDRLTLAAKYEFQTRLNVENDTEVDDTGLFGDGVNTAHDIPAYLSLGASYKLLPHITLSMGYHHFFDSKARMQNDKQKDAGNTNEYLLGIECQVNDYLLFSVGGQITDYGVGDTYQRDLSFACSSYSIGLGGAIKVTPAVAINVAYFWSKYQDYTKTPGGGIENNARTTKDVFSRTNKVFGAGVDFSF